MADLESRIVAPGEGEPVEIKRDPNPARRLNFLGGHPRDKDKGDRNSLRGYALALYNSAIRLGTELYNRFL